MRTLSPNLDRLGAALRALRESHDTSGKDNASLGVDCLALVIRQLAGEGLPKEDLQPLIELEAVLRQQQSGRTARERRLGKPPSEVMLARIAGVIDLLVKAGYDEAVAAQLIMRKLLASGVAPPRQGGDARGWKCLLLWRADLSFGLVSDEAKTEYRAFTHELEAIPAKERVKRVLDEQLWDRRRKRR